MKIKQKYIFNDAISEILELLNYYNKLLNSKKELDVQEELNFEDTQIYFYVENADITDNDIYTEFIDDLCYIIQTRKNMPKKIEKKESKVDQIRERVKEKPSELEPVSKQILIPTGSIMLNLACSDNINGGFAPGKIVNLIGDSSSGKTLLALTMFADIVNDPQFDDYRLIFDDAEEALEFDIGYLFGENTAKRIEMDQTSNTIEDYYGNVLRALSKGKPFIYVLDSFDAITADEEIKRSKEYENDKSDKSGSYKTEKARMSSEILRVIKGGIKETKSVVEIISQTRDNIGFGAMFQPKVRTGGKALKFYSCNEIWLAVGKKVSKNDLEIGANVMAKVSKNKLTGKKRDIVFPIFYDYGVDNLQSCIFFLIEQKVWKKEKQTIHSNDLCLPCTISKLIKEIEDNNLEQEVFNATQDAWTAREDSLKLNRKKKYN